MAAASEDVMSLRTNGVGRQIAWGVVLALLLVTPARVFAHQFVSSLF
jgi:hypothetical protein